LIRGRVPETRRPARDDGYHSPQVSVAVRLNTNESPIEPTAEFVAALAAAVRDVRWNRYPDRAVRELRTAVGELHGVGADNVFVANGSNEVLQAVLLAYSGAGRSVATFEPTYQLHSHIARIGSASVVNGVATTTSRLPPPKCAEHSPSVAFLFRLDARLGRQVWQALLDASVLVRDCSSWEGLADCLRVTVSTRPENNAFLAALRGAVAARD
jgi:histidinol-phosphate/aromatic aminotransferase/cobyric acid decarboxylase-like protein